MMCYAIHLDREVVTERLQDIVENEVKIEL